MKEELQGFLDSLLTPEITFFPIRHHSPACAWHLQNLIREQRPKTILIEGPGALTRWIPALLQPELKPPVAVYMIWADRERKMIPSSDLPGPTPPRFAAYYPFCDYSPELVALREGKAAGADLYFIDLPYPEQVKSDSRLREKLEDWRNFSLLHEAHLTSSEYVKQLSRRTGCRNHDELWDHFFEIHSREVTTAQFIKNVAAYCYMARRDYDESVLEFDGTLAREREMARRIKNHLGRLKAKDQGSFLVVTGGFHTVNLPRLVGDSGSTKSDSGEFQDDAEYYLIRYSFDQLDAINGYASGMRSPRYYDMVWNRMNQNHADPFAETAADLLVEIGRLTRERNLPFSLSAADEIAALEQSRRLAMMRGHRSPTREDFLDGVRSCFVKGSLDSEGALLMKIVQKELSGEKIGSLPDGVSSPPLIASFHEAATCLRLNLENTTCREVDLEIYRKPRDRKVSRLFYSLAFLEVPFARMLSGPDFAVGFQLDYLNETWEYGWSPATDSSLIKASVLGSTLEEAVANRLDEVIHHLDNEGRGRSAGAAVGFLFRALQMGIHNQIDRMIDRIAAGIAEDPEFISVVEALRQLMIIHTAREPLEATRIPSLLILANEAYRKATFLMQDLYSKPVESTTQVVESLCILGELIETKTDGDFDPDLLYQSLKVLSQKIKGNMGVIGAAWGLLYRCGYTTSANLQNVLVGFLNATTVENQNKTAFIYGLLRTCREICWREEWFVKLFDELCQGWDDKEFLTRLPELRLAFAGLTPSETDRVAAYAARLHGTTDLGELVIREITETEAQQNLIINEMVKQTLDEDGLGIWLSLSDSSKEGKAE